LQKTPSMQAVPFGTPAHQRTVVVVDRVAVPPEVASSAEAVVPRMAPSCTVAPTITSTRTMRIPPAGTFTNVHCVVEPASGATSDVAKLTFAS